MPGEPKTIDQMLSEMVNIYENEYYKQTNNKTTLKAADSERIEMYTFAAMFYQLYELIEYNTRMNFIQYAESEFLDKLGELLDVERLPAQYASTMVKVTLSKKAENMMIIPAGTRVSAGTNVFFAASKMVAIESGQAEVMVPFKANMAGKEGNGFLPGQLNILVDPLPFVAAVENTEETRGGADVEDDSSLRNRIGLKPKGLSVAGPEKAYQYFAYSYSQSIADVCVSSPLAGVVDIRVLLQKGELPTESILESINGYLLPYRPMTDQLSVSAPEIMSFDLDLTYYIPSSKQQFIEEIKASIESAIAEFELKQISSIGKNIVPDELVRMCLDAGAYRVEVRSPVYTVVDQITVAHPLHTTIVFGGVDDD